MIPWGFSDGETPVKTYKDFQEFSLECRESALKWLRGRVDHWEIVKSLITSNKAANDNGLSEQGTLLLSKQEFVAMLYCWVENDRDEVKAKLAYVEGCQYNPLP